MTRIKIAIFSIIIILLIALANAPFMKGYLQAFGQSEDIHFHDEYTQELIQTQFGAIDNLDLIPGVKNMGLVTSFGTKTAPVFHGAKPENIFITSGQSTCHSLNCQNISDELPNIIVPVEKASKINTASLSTPSAAEQPIDPDINSIVGAALFNNARTGINGIAPARTSLPAGIIAFGGVTAGPVATPLPGAALFMGSAILGGLGWRRKNKRSV